jgi:hypothetical protein
MLYVDASGGKMSRFQKTLGMIAVAASAAWAQVPAGIAAKLVDMGRNVCPADTAKLYRGFQPTAPYPEVKVERDIHYGPGDREILDVFSPEKGGGNRPVLIYVAGGAGNKIEQVPDGEAFYDNIMLWAVKNGMTGVNVQRGGTGTEWDDAAKQIAKMVEWVHTNIAKYKGNPNRVFIWSHSAGNPPVGTYIGRPELYPSFGIGLKGAILMSPAAFNIAPVTVGGAGGGAPAGGRGTAGGPPAGGCPSGGAFGGGARGGGAAKGGPGGGAKGTDAAKGGGGRGGGGRGPVDPATQLARSTLPGIKAAKISFFLAYADLDPANMGSFIDTLKDQLCMAGHCPTVAVFKDHSHMSEVFSPGSPDTEVSGPILKWIKSVK